MFVTATAWTGRFGDKRLEKKGGLLFRRLVARSSCILRRIGRGRAEELGFGRFLANPKVTEGEIVAAASRPLEASCRGRHVLAIQDTTELNYEHHRGRVRGLGPAGNGSDRGFFVHPVIAVDAEDGTLLGLAGAELWTRPEPPEDAVEARRVRAYRKLPIEGKESYRWLEVAEQAKGVLARAARVTVIGDRESDIYEEWARLPDARCDMITRASRDRALVGGGRLFDVAESWREAGRRKIEPRAQPGRKKRKATLSLRFGTVTIKRPERCTDPTAPESLSLRLVEVREVDSQVAEPIHWLLLTTHGVEKAEDAWRIVGWYRERWHIEQIFRTLKRQGLNIESSQVTSAEALMKLAAMALVAAVRIMQLVLARDGGGGRPASDVLDPELLPFARALLHELEGKTAKQKNPHLDGTLAWLAWIIARLGGWNGYPSERPPGPITMHNGWQQFKSMQQGWALHEDV